MTRRCVFCDGVPLTRERVTSLAALTGSGLTGGALGVGTGVELSRLGLDVGPRDVLGAHRLSSSFSAIR